MYEIKIARVVTVKLEPQIDSQNNVETHYFWKIIFLLCDQTILFNKFWKSKTEKIENWKMFVATMLVI